MAAYFVSYSQTTTANATPVRTLADDDRLMVGPTAMLATTGTSSPVIQGGREVTISLAGDLFALQSGGIEAGASGNVRVTAEGSITSYYAAIDFSGDSAEVTNAGGIQAEAAAIVFDAGGLLVNTGLIAGSFGLYATGTVELSNAGIIQGAGSHTTYSWVAGAGVRVWGSADIVNTGSIVGLMGFGIDAGKYNDATASVTIRNSGTIAGATTHGAIGTQYGDDTVMNAGTLIGRVRLGPGDDLYDGTRGRADGEVAGEAGADTLLGGDGAERLNGGDGADEIDAGAGNDTVIGGAGADLLAGGEGRDLLSYATSLAAVSLDIGSIDFGGGHADGDEVSGFEAYAGSSYADTLIGSAAADVLYGGAGNDRLDSKAGNDRLFGQAGADQLIGGAGADQLRGGAGADIFRYTALADSTTAVAGRDRVIDFSQAEGDVIHLWSIDANSAVAGNQAFTFIGTTAFGHVAGQLRYQQVGSGTMVYADATGDGEADLQILLVGTHTLQATDFVL